MPDVVQMLSEHLLLNWYNYTIVPLKSLYLTHGRSVMHTITSKKSKQWAMGVSNQNAPTRAWSLFAHTENIFGKLTERIDTEFPFTPLRKVKEF